MSFRNNRICRLTGKNMGLIHIDYSTFPMMDFQLVLFVRANIGRTVITLKKLKIFAE